MRIARVAVLIVALAGLGRAGTITYTLDATFTPFPCSDAWPSCPPELSGNGGVQLLTVPSWMSYNAFEGFAGGYVPQGDSLAIEGNSFWPYLWVGVSVPVYPNHGGIQFETGVWPVSGTVLDNFNTGYGGSEFTGYLSGVCESGDCVPTPEPPTLVTTAGVLILLGIGWRLRDRVAGLGPVHLAASVGPGAPCPCDAPVGRAVVRADKGHPLGRNEIGAALAGAAPPACRAASIDPAIILRYE